MAGAIDVRYNKIPWSSLDHAYEYNDLEYQLHFATQLIEEALFDLEEICKHLKCGDTTQGLAELSNTKQTLTRFIIDARLDVNYNWLSWQRSLLERKPKRSLPKKGKQKKNNEKEESRHPIRCRF